MANSIPAAPVVPDVGLLLSGQSLDSQSISPLGEAANWLASRLGSATPRVLQVYPVEGASAPGQSVCIYTDTTQRQVAEWRIPATRVATSVECYLYAISTAITSTVRWDSVAAGDSVTTAIGNSWSLVQASLTIDTAAGYETIRMYLDVGAAPATIQVGAVLVMLPPEAALTSPYWVEPFDGSELSIDQSLNAEQGRRLLSSLPTMREGAPHVYWSWSGFAHEALTDPQSRYMVAWPHVMPMLVWADTAREDWTCEIHVRVQQGTLPQTIVVHCQGSTSDPFFRSTAISVPVGASVVWVTGSIRLPTQRRTARNMPAGWESILVSVWPEPSRAGAVDEWSRVQGETPDQLSSRSIMSICMWGV